MLMIAPTICVKMEVSVKMELTSTAVNAPLSLLANFVKLSPSLHTSIQKHHRANSMIVVLGFVWMALAQLITHASALQGIQESDVNI